MKTGIELITAERQRQIEVEGFDVVNDEGYDILQLSAAAGCYIANACNKFFYENTEAEERVTSRFQVLVDCTTQQHKGKKMWIDGWPWDKEWDKREKHDIVRSLEIAGALIAAELDRINGVAPSPHPYKTQPSGKAVSANLNCMYCGVDFIGEEPKMCCSGKDCGCMGMPIEPVVCSKGCYEMLINSRKPPSPSVEEVVIPPGKNKPFIVANVREITEQYFFNNNPISYSRMVELFNEVAFKWIEQTGAKYTRQDMEKAVRLGAEFMKKHNVYPLSTEKDEIVKSLGK